MMRRVSRRPSALLWSTATTATSLQNCRRLAATTSSSSSDRPPVGALPNVDPGAPPPIPEGYVPIDSRTDDSISFVRDAEGKRYITGIQPDTVLHIRQPVPKVFANVNAERLKSTSVMGGQGLVSGTGYAFHATTIPQDEAGRGGLGGADPAALRQLESTLAARDKTQEVHLPPMFEGDHDMRHAAESELGIGSSSAEASKIETEKWYQHDARAHGKAFAAPKTPKELVEEIEAEMKKISYFEGTPKHAQMVADFKKKYMDQKKQMDAAYYSSDEIAVGRVGEPVDFDRLSPALQHEINTNNILPWVAKGAGIGKDMGYHFSPLKEIGKIKMGSIDLSVASPDTVKMLQAGEDRSLAFRLLGLDAVQRHQIRFMFSDLPKGDNISAFHVLRSYPYAKYLYNFLFIVVMILLYKGQKRFNVMAVYDEYCGLDFIQAPKLENPLYSFMSFMYAALLAPFIIWGVIGTNRMYRIWRRRPIGPP